jgi:hypothetical protein
MFGAYAGEKTTTSGNSFFGTFAGQKNTNGFSNVFVGMNAGKENLNGSYNTYIGFGAGSNGISGSDNIAVGRNAQVGANVSGSIAFGANASVLQSNTFLVGGNVSKSVFNTDLNVSGDFQASGGKFTGNLQTTNLSVGLSGLTVSGAATFSGDATFNGGLNAQTVAASGNGLFQGSVRADTIGMKQLWNGGSSQICVVDSAGYKYISNCSSSRRYKTDIQDFKSGLSIVNRLRPVTFIWKSNGQKDVGFVAEEVNEIEPLLNNFNENGEVEGVKYAQVTTALVNAVREQQTQIEKQQEQIKEQQAQIEALKALICTGNSNSAVCQPAKKGDFEE